MAECDLEEAERELAEIFDEVGLLRGGGRQVGATGKLPESSVEYSNVESRYSHAIVSGWLNAKAERERDREKER